MNVSVYPYRACSKFAIKQKVQSVRLPSLSHRSLLILLALVVVLLVSVRSFPSSNLVSVTLKAFKRRGQAKRPFTYELEFPQGHFAAGKKVKKETFFASLTN